jgi:hypothetical protein
MRRQEFNIADQHGKPIAVNGYVRERQVNDMLVKYTLHRHHQNQPWVLSEYHTGFAMHRGVSPATTIERVEQSFWDRLERRPDLVNQLSTTIDNSNHVNF